MHFLTVHHLELPIIYSQAPVLADRDQPPPVLRKLHAIYRVAVMLDNLPYLPVLGAPDDDSTGLLVLALAAGGQQPTAVAPG